MGCLWRRRSTAGLPLCPDTSLNLLLYLLLSFRGGGRGCESRQLNISSHISHTHSTPLVNRDVLVLCLYCVLHPLVLCLALCVSRVQHRVKTPPKSPYERLRIDRKHSRLQFLRTYEAARRTAGGKNNQRQQHTNKTQLVITICRLRQN